MKRSHIFKNIIRLNLILFIILFASDFASAHRFHYVKWDASGFNNGSNWANAFNNLQDALNVAFANDTIFVAEGTYYPDRGKTVTPGSRTASFELRNGVVILGGFKGNEIFQSFESSTPSEFWKKHWRDWQNNKTILSGDLLENDNTNISPDEPTRSDNSLHILTKSSMIDSTAAINGFYIRGGNSNSTSTFSGSRGGALYISNANGNFKIENCVFENNTAIESGGAIFSNSTAIRVKFSSFINNYAKTGGAVSFAGNDNLSDPRIPHVVNSYFYQNRSETHGAGVHTYNAANAYIINSVFTENTTTGSGSSGAGIYADNKSYPEIANCTFYKNSSVSAGGAITLCAGRVSNSILRGNTASTESQIFIEGEPANPAANRAFLSSSIEGGFTGTDIIDVDPMFIQPDNPKGADDYFGTPDDGLVLQNSSALIDKGTSWLNIQQSDIRGFPRKSNDIVDIGAYEHQRITVDYRLLYEDLKKGGFILLYRHAITDHSQQDQPGYLNDLGNCSLQRNLSIEGRKQTDFLWHMMKLLNIPTDTAIASPLCRTQHTARYIYGPYKTSVVWMGVDPQYTNSKRNYLGRIPPDGKNAVIVTHMNSIEEVTSYKKGEVHEGDVVVIKPLGGMNFQEIGHITTDTWEKMIKFVENGPIPVELISFTASLLKDQIALRWETSTETNNRGFEIERRINSDSEIQWEKIGFVPGKGTTTEIQVYSYIDKPAAAGKYLYRLKQIDFDGTFEYSNIAEASFNTKLTYSLLQNYPNPFNPETEIKYSIVEDGMVSIEVFNSIGEKVKNLVNEILQAGDHKINFNAGGLASGLYFYKITAGDFVQTKKMILLR